MVGLVLVSHSRTLVEGLRDIVAQFGGDDVPIALAGGTPDGRLGTTADRITAAIREVLGHDPSNSDGAVVLFDFGSAALSLEIALEELDVVERSRVRVPEAPLVEGAFAAGVQASIGASLDDVAAAAASASALSKSI
ncbi:MAG: dihydroxyacetone kinase phosphoryl donor subunit DhaM [Candidatus Limnocylindrales bacterium]